MSRKHTSSMDKSRTNSYQHLLKDKSDPHFFHNISETNKSIKHQLEEFFESHWFHIALFVLLGIDLSIVLFEIILILLYCDDIPHDLHALSQDLVYISIGNVFCQHMHLTNSIHVSINKRDFGFFSCRTIDGNVCMGN